MAAWQVEFQIVPERALGKGPRPLTAVSVADTPWWEGTRVPHGFRMQLDAVAPRGRHSSGDLETWGDVDGNRVDVRSEGGAIRNVVAMVDVRRLDARFAAALLGLVRQLGAVLVRRDGLVANPTIAAFTGALRGSTAWVHANDPATWLAEQVPDDDAEG